MVTEAQKEQAQFWLEYSQQLSGTIRYTEALAAVERSLALDDTSVAAWYAKGTYLAMLARYNEALAAFEHSLAMDDAYAPAWDGRAWALGILGRREEALAAVNRALELDPEYFDALKRYKLNRFCTSAIISRWIFSTVLEASTTLIRSGYLRASIRKPSCTF
jgi:tetratricopeptide (TPR) repeat protein